MNAKKAFTRTQSHTLVRGRLCATAAPEPTPEPQPEPEPTPESTPEPAPSE